MANPYVEEIVKLERRGAAWEYAERCGDCVCHMSVSDDGRAALADLANIFATHAEALRTFMQVMGQTVCRFGRPLSDHEWVINDYVESVDGCSGLFPWFILSAFHWDLDPVTHGRGEAYCIPYEYHAGIVMATEDAA